MKQIKYKNVEEMLSQQQATDRGSYFICECPSCKKKEAFVYKNNPRFIICNRENNCGEKHFIKYGKESDLRKTRLETSKQKFPSLTNEQIQSLDWSERFFDYMRKHHISPTFEHGYRGISNDVLSEYIVDTQKEDLTKFMFQKMQPLFKKSYQNSDFMINRNIVMPIYDDDENLERVVLRSSTDKDAEPKEIQLVANPSKDARDFFIDMNDKSSRLVITESLFDALSFKEVDNKASFIALTGIQKTNKIKEYIKDNLSDFKYKKIVIAFDDDSAGKNGTEEFKKFLKEQDVEYTVFNYESKKNPNIKDPNEFLQESKNDFREVYKESLMKMVKKKEKSNELEM